jgi:hypothetical protein
MVSVRNKSRGLRLVLGAVAVATAMAGFGVTAPAAKAEGYYRGGYGHGYSHGWYGPRIGFGYYPPAYYGPRYYAPPPVYYAPPAYYGRPYYPGSFNVTIPIR